MEYIYSKFHFWVNFVLVIIQQMLTSKTIMKQKMTNKKIKK